MKQRGTNKMSPQNKLGITSSPELAEAEERISKKKAVELLENGVPDNLEAGYYYEGYTTFKTEEL